MTGPGTVSSGAKTPLTGGVDRWIGRAAAATVGGLAGIAGALSYSHMRQLAQDHGQAGWHAHAFPLSVDGIEIVASLVLLADRRAGRRPRWLPWAALMIGTAGSLTANVATAGPDMISRIIAGWPALALLIAVKLLAGMLGHHTTSRQAAIPADPSRDRKVDVPPFTAAPIPSGSPSTTRSPTVAPPPGPHGSPAVRRTNPSAVPESATIPSLPGIANLLPAARAARDSLHRDGHRLTRDALAARMRENGCPVRNARMTPLLQALRNESTVLSPTSTNTAA